MLATFALAAGAQDVPPVDVIVVDGPLDQRAIRFVQETVLESAEGGAQAAVIQLDSPGALNEEIDDLIAFFQNPPLPLAVWVGDAPAVAYGGAAQLLLAAPLKTAAPGVEIGHLTPTVAGSHRQLEVVAGVDSFELMEATMKVEGPVPGLIDEVLPSIGQVVVWLNGQEVSFEKGTTVLSTSREEIGDDGAVRILPTAQVRFHEPGVLSRMLRLAIRPEAAFFFLAVGLTVAAFEFYAIGPGVAAAVGALAILIGGYGLATLPVRWWSLVLIGLSLLIYTVEFQRRSFGLLSILATGGLLAGGFFLTDAAPQIIPTPWGVVLTVLAVIFFYLIAMPVVARSRFATATIGRTHLIGRTGSALTGLGPDGVVEVDGARWQARSHREAGIEEGDGVTVTAVRGLVLEVDPVSEETTG